MSQDPGPGRTQRALHQGPVPDRPAAGTVTCPAQHTAAIVYNPNPGHRHHGQASFGPACASCPLRGQCTNETAGRTITITAYERELAAARARQADPARAADYRATRPKVERNSPIWSAAATAAAGCGSVVLSRWPPTSTCWPPRSTWPGWACSVCTGPHRVAGQQHEPTGVPPPQPCTRSAGHHAQPTADTACSDPAGGSMLEDYAA